MDAELDSNTYTSYKTEKEQVGNIDLKESKAGYEKVPRCLVDIASMDSSISPSKSDNNG